MARRICIRLAEPNPDPIEMTMPGTAVVVKSIRDFTAEGYDVCSDARAFLMQLSPMLAGLGLPLCVLGCVQAISEVFDASRVPPVSPKAIPNMIDKCGCLTGFTPFGFCSVLKGVVSSIQLLLRCVVGLMGDIVLIEAKAANMLLDPDEVVQFAARCALGNAGTQLRSIQAAFGPIAELFNTLGFLFEFVGVALTPITNLTGDTASEVLGVTQQVLAVLDTVNDAIESVCP